jgi:dCMP deaminase
MNPLKFIPVAQALAQLSKDPSTKVASIAFDDLGNILSVGYNGFPRGVNDAKERYENRAEKLRLISHSEANTIAQAARVGAKLDGASLLVTALYPCSTCAKLIIQAGIKKVYAPVMENDSKWFEEREIAMLLFREAEVEVYEYDPT